MWSGSLQHASRECTRTRGAPPENFDLHLLGHGKPALRSEFHSEVCSVWGAGGARQGETMTEDAELLRRYFEDRSEEAFAELVSRHLSLVYFTALRRVNGQAQLAEDVSQAVFISLARSAGQLRGRPALGGWLYSAAKNAAANVLRAEKRRKAREEEAIAMQHSLGPENEHARWAELRPVIDHAMDRLNAADREAVILRYFQGEPWAHIGAVLRTSEDAARVRVGRALDKLRGSLSREGYTSTAAALGAVLSGQASAAAIPAGLAAAVTGSALAMGGAAGGTALVGALGFWTFMSTTKLAVGVVAVVAAIGIGIALKVTPNEREMPAEAIAAAPRPPSEDGLLAISNAASSSEADFQGVARVRSAAAPDVPENHYSESDMQELLTIQQDRLIQNKAIYAHLFTELQLSDEEVDQLCVLLGERQSLPGDVFTALATRQVQIPRGTDLTPPIAALQAEVEKEIQSFLGNEKYRKYQQYYQELPGRILAMRITEELRVAQRPLAHEQAEVLRALLISAHQSKAMHNIAAPGWRFDMGMVKTDRGRTFLVPVTESVRIDEATMEIVGQVLTEEQLAALTYRK